MSDREDAIHAWANYCRRFGLSPQQLVGCTFPGHEKFRVDRALVRDIQMSLDPPVEN